MAPMSEVDDLSLFGTVLHARGAAGTGPELVDPRARPPRAASFRPTDIQPLGAVPGGRVRLMGEEDGMTAAT